MLQYQADIKHRHNRTGNELYDFTIKQQLSSSKKKKIQAVRRIISTQIDLHVTYLLRNLCMFFTRILSCPLTQTKGFDMTRFSK